MPRTVRTEPGTVAGDVAVQNSVQPPPRGSEARLQVIGILLRTPLEIERVVSACWQP